jgi:hypothetical protein
VYVPNKPPLTIGEYIEVLPVILLALRLFPTYTSPQILADAFTTNPLSGEIDAVNEPLFNINVSNDIFAKLIFVKPLPSPINVEPLATITFPPLTNTEPLTVNEPENILTDVLTSNPLFGDITP